ncbi:MAG TPA: ABC transporter transmembrane domain-containing protein [Gemmataceae bacterium]|nr:ABC transporter transmembrane domain-containing protein [Gemmataceae bacterium]
MRRHHHPPIDAGAPPPRLSWAALREVARLAAYLLPYRRKFVLAHLCLLVGSLAGLAFPFFTGRLIDGASRSLGGLPGGTGWAIGTAGVNTTALLLMVGLAVQALCASLQTYWLTEVGERSLADLRRDTYGRLIRLPMAFFARRRVGELTGRLAADLSLLQQTLTGSGPQFLGQLVVLAGGLVLIALTSVRLTLVMLASVPVVIGLAVVFGRLTRKVSFEARERLADTNVVVEETLQGIAGVKAFTNEDHETDRYRAGLQRFIGVVLRGALYQGAFTAFITFAGFGSIVLVIWYGARLVEEGALSFGDLTQFLLYTMFIGGAIGGFARLYGELQRTVGATQRVRELLRETPEESGYTTSALSLNGVGRVAGDIAFEGVTFAYPSRKEVTVLRDLSLAAKAGRRIALVGPSGAGKSTIVSLLLRFYDPDAGRLLIDGRDARDYPLRRLREQMALVPQDVLLFGGTVADNIAYGRPGASQAEIEEAARRANAHDFIAAFPEGYRTVVGERGVQLSGGQRQRVAIARAILKNPAILILDEATSALDSESERLVQQALDALMEGRTSVIIAHRLSTVRRADCIYVVKEGEVVEAGTHAELVARPDGLYRSLSELQFDLGEPEGAPLTPGGRKGLA